MENLHHKKYYHWIAMKTLLQKEKLLAFKQFLLLRQCFQVVFFKCIYMWERVNCLMWVALCKKSCFDIYHKSHLCRPFLKSMCQFEKLLITIIFVLFPLQCFQKKLLSFSYSDQSHQIAVIGFSMLRYQQTFISCLYFFSFSCLPDLKWSAKSVCAIYKCVQG